MECSGDSGHNNDYPHCSDASKKYRKLAKIGHGTFGEVFKAKNTKSGEMVALKKVLVNNNEDGFPLTTIREIKILQVLQHENIVRLIEVCHSRDRDSNGEYKQTIYLVFEFCEHDLAGLLSNPNLELNLPEIKNIAQQFLSGVFYLHKNKLLHRDLKAANILINKAGVLKVADFGLSRPFSHTTNRLTNCVITLWYRPPELLLGEKTYGPAVDMWGAGCLLAELWTRRPILQASTEQKQLTLISQLCGSITPTAWPSVTKLRLYHSIELPKGHRRRVRPALQSMGLRDELGLDLVDSLLTLDPSSRMDADRALDHDFFFSEPLPESDISGKLGQLTRSNFEYLCRRGVDTAVGGAGGGGAAGPLKEMAAWHHGGKQRMQAAVGAGKMVSRTARQQQHLGLDKDQHIEPVF